MSETEDSGASRREFIAECLNMLSIHATSAKGSPRSVTMSA